MPFLAEHHISIPALDINSWYFDDPECEPDRPIYIDTTDTSKNYTWRTARTTIRKLIAGLRKAGLKRGDNVCIHSFNDLNYPIIVNAVIGAGGIFSGTNPAYTAHELSHAISAAKVNWFITEPEMLVNVIKAAEDNKIPKNKIFIFDNDHNNGKIAEGYRSWRWLLEHGEEDWVRINDKKTAKSTTTARLFSSGTTGFPKAAIFNHWNFIAQHRQTNDFAPKPYQVKRLIALPMFHVACVPAMHFSPLRNGAETYIMRRFDLELFLANMEKFEITDMPVVPPMAIMIIMSDLRHKYSLKAVRSVSCGAAPLDKGPQARLKKLLAPGAPFGQVWGMTETTCIATFFPFPEDDDTGSVGYPGPDLDLKLVDDDGNDITGYDVRGEMCIRGETVIDGYLDNPEGNKSWDSDGYFHTGDIMYCDKQTKKWYVVDRKKELIKVRGFQVAPPELEAVLLGHPLIIDAAVIGVPLAADGGELPRAYIVRRKVPEAEKEVTEESVKKYMAERLAKFKTPDGGVVFVDEIPKNPSGKILKRVLRERAKKETGSKL